MSYYEEERIPQLQLSERRVKAARKQHRCSDCLRHIEIGTSYVREFWLVDGEATSITRHHGCFTY